jgi:class 3 adenylate cyclase
MTQPKTQTRGFLFADLRGFTAFTERHGDEAARELITRYRALVRAEIDRYDGAEIRTEGDGFYIVFGSVADAVVAGLAIRDAAAAMSAAPDAIPVRVGIGIHAGEARDGDAGIVSSAVNIAARICAAAHPGEVLVSDTVRGLVRTSVGAVFAPRGRRRLKGISEPIELFAVERQGGQTVSGSWRQPSRLAVVGLGLLLATIVLVAVVAGLPRQIAGGADDGSPTASAGAPSEASATDQPAFPDADEHALLERLPEAITASCLRADPSRAPRVNESRAAGNLVFERTIPMALQAGITCVTGVVRVDFWEALRASDVDGAFARRVALRGIPEGDCGDRARAWQPWTFGLYAGKLMCSSTPGESADLEWTYGEEPIYAIASRGDGDVAALLSWWREIGRLLSR